MNSLIKGNVGPKRIDIGISAQLGIDEIELGCRARQSFFFWVLRYLYLFTRESVQLSLTLLQ